MKFTTKKKKWLGAALLCLIFGIIAYFIGNEYVKAETVVDGNYQYIYDNEGNELTVLEINKYTGTIYLHGKHVRSTATISYRTLGYNFALKDSSEAPRSLGDENYAYIERKEDDGGGSNPFKPSENYVLDSYKLDGTEVTNTVINLMRNQKNADGTKTYKNIMEINAALAKGVTVYMSNAFKVITRNGGSGSEVDGYTAVGKLCHSYNEIIKEVRSLYGVDWSAATQKILHYYYDNPITIKLTPFKFNAVYITEENYNAGKTGSEYILGNAVENEETICGSESAVTIKDTSNIPINGNTYEYAGKSYYKYWGKDGFYETKTSNGTISMKHEFQRDATMYILVKSNGDNNVKIRYVNEKGKVIKSNIDGGKLTLGKLYSYSNMESPVSIYGTVYEYNNKFSYSYTNKSGSSKDSGTKTGTPKFTLSDVKKDSEVILTLVYAEGEQEIGESINISYFEPNATGVIKADNRGSEKFDVTTGIPTTEDLYGNVKASEYLINASFSKVTGEKFYPIKVSKTYTLKWEKPIYNPTPTPGGTIKYETVSETRTVTKVMYVKKNYTYTEIKNIEYYKINNATLNNYALPNQRITLTPSNYSVPSLNYTHYSSDSERFIDPAQVKTGIVLSSQTISSGSTSKPSIPDETGLFQSQAESRTEEIKVRNDYMEFGGSVVLDNKYTVKQAPNIVTSAVKKPSTIADTVLYNSSLTIDATKMNGNFSSNGNLSYTQVIGYNSKKASSLNYNIENLNNVIIHTPVYCEGTLANDNKKYVQLVNPDTTSVPIVLDDAGAGITNDFIVSISNTGLHSVKKGYGNRDYSVNTKGSASYIASKNGALRNEVRFPFDVIIDVGKDNKTSNDILIPAWTWYTIGTSSYRMYVPMYVSEGNYTVDFRTVSVNGGDKYITYTEHQSNSEFSKYVATDSIQVQISGKIYGLTLYDINDYPQWKEIFRKYQSSQLKINDSSVSDGTLKGKKYNRDLLYYYTVGTKDQYGLDTGRNNRYTFPLVSGSYPASANVGVQKAGYTWRFTLDTIGSEAMNASSYVQIKPKFFYVDKNGKNRKEVDLYYDETINGSKKTLVKVGGNIDKSNHNLVINNDWQLGIPKDEFLTTASIWGKTEKEWIQRDIMYTYGSLISKKGFKTFTNTEYANSLEKTSVGKNIYATGVKREDLITKKQSYYFNYCLPANFKAVAKGYDVVGYSQKYGVRYNENFWKKEGYIIINFEITLFDSKGNAYLSYINADNYLKNGNASMWVTEGALKEKKDHYGVNFEFKAGDFLMIYTDKNSSDDYNVGGIY